MERINENNKEIELPEKDANIFEIAEFFDKNPELITFEYLENFYFNLPGGMLRQKEFMINEDKLKDYRITHKDGKEVRNEELNYHSEKRLNQTDQEFFDTIDQAIEELGFELEEIEQANKNILELVKLKPEDKDSYKEKEEEKIINKYAILNQINNKLVKIYQALRKIGYSHYDLVR